MKSMPCCLLISVIFISRLLAAHGFITGDSGGNERVRLVVDPTSSGKLASTATVDENYATQWYTTRGMWRRFRLRFTAMNSLTDVGIQLYQWWLLDEDHIFIDDLELHELPENPE